MTACLLRLSAAAALSALVPLATNDQSARPRPVPTAYKASACLKSALNRTYNGSEINSFLARELEPKAWKKRRQRGAVCTDNLNAGVVVMKSYQDGA